MREVLERMMGSSDLRGSTRRARLQRIRWPLLGLLLLSGWAALRATVAEPSHNCLAEQSRLRSRSAPAAQFGQRSYCWGLIGNDGMHLTAERDAGIVLKVWRLSWRSAMPGPDTLDRAYLARKHTELAQLRQAGFQIVLSVGLHDPPRWAHDRYSDSYYVNQFGEPYRGDGPDSGDLNIVFNPALRALVAAYLQNVFAEFGTDFAAVRLGGGRYGELTYPPAQYQAHRNTYWAFDRNAAAQSPTPNWRPGQPSPAGEANLFLQWYLDRLVEFQSWQISTVRQHYDGPLLLLYPSWGIRPGQIEQAISVNLDGTTAAERNGEIQRGLDTARQIAALSDPGTIVTTTWLDADATADDQPDQRYWSPVKYLASQAQQHPLKLQLYGENTGQGQTVELELAALQVQRYGLLGMAWYREEELFSGQYASLADYQRVIRRERLPGW